MRSTTDEYWLDGRSPSSPVDERRRDWLAVGGLALGVRATVAAGLSITLAAGGRAQLFPDEGTFLSEAHSVRAGGDFTEHGYANLLGLLFRLTGESAWLPRWLNVIAGAALAVVVYELARLLAGRRAALWAGIAIAVWPSLVLWSAVVLKDSLTLLALFGAVLATTWAFYGRWAGVIAAVGAMGLLEVLRPWAFTLASLALGAAAVAHLAVTRGRRLATPLVLVALVGIIGVAGGEGFLGARFAHVNSDTDRVEFARAEGSAGGDTACAHHPADDVVDTIRGIPGGFACSILGPAPWQAGSRPAAALVAVELAFWYAALLLAALALPRLRWRLLAPPWVMLLAMAAGVVAVLSVYERNGGTALRERGSVVPVAVLLAASGFAAHRRSDAARRHLATVDAIDAPPQRPASSHEPAGEQDGHPTGVPAFKSPREDRRIHRADRGFSMAERDTSDLSWQSGKTRVTARNLDGGAMADTTMTTTPSTTA